MPTPDSRARRHAWMLTLLLTAALAASASFGVNHEYLTARERFAACTQACQEPARPGSVAVFAVLAAALVLWAAALAVRDLRRRSVELVLRGLQPVGQ